MGIKWLRVVQILLLIMVCIASYKSYSYHQADRRFLADQEDLLINMENWEADLNEQAVIKKSALSEDLLATEKISYLKEKYPQIVGWITIPGTEIDAPIVQGEDNDFYLNHDYKGNPHPFGAIFLEKENSGDFSDQNSILYGHNVKTGRVFHPLEQYRDPVFLDKAPMIEISTERGLFCYRIFAVYQAEPYHNFRSPYYADDQAYEEFVDGIRKRNIIPGDLPKAMNDLLTLQTCLENDTRLVIHAKRVT